MSDDFTREDSRADCAEDCSEEAAADVKVVAERVTRKSGNYAYAAYLESTRQRTT